MVPSHATNSRRERHRHSYAANDASRADLVGQVEVGYCFVGAARSGPASQPIRAPAPEDLQGRGDRARPLM